MQKRIVKTILELMQKLDALNRHARDMALGEAL